MALLSKTEAQERSLMRFPNEPSRRESFMEGWRGLHNKRGRDKYREHFGRGRRSRRMTR